MSSAIIKEAKQVGLLYHFTSLRAAISIVEGDKLIASKIYGRAKQIFNKFGIYKAISFTRDKNFLNSRIFQKGSTPKINGFAVTFVVDGDMLSNYYKIRPYDDRIGITSKISLEDMGDEMEEMIYGDKIEKDGGIVNFKKFVKKIIINKINIGEETIQNLYDIYIFFKKSGYNVELERKTTFDEKFNSVKYYLKYLQIKNYNIREDGKIDVDGDVKISGKNLIKIPIPFGRVKGDFIANSNALTSMQNSPEFVGGDYSVTVNRLTDLKGIPKEVEGDFYIYYNKNNFSEYKIRLLSNIKGEVHA
jgi:hypothetical protein